MEVITKEELVVTKIEEVAFGTPIKCPGVTSFRYMVVDKGVWGSPKHVAVANLSTGLIEELPHGTMVIIVDMVCSETE